MTSLVTGSGNRSIALTTAGATALKLVSREGTNKPGFPSSLSKPSTRPPRQSPSPSPPAARPRLSARPSRAPPGPRPAGLESGHASDLVRLRSDRDTGSDPDGDPERGVMVGRRLAGARPRHLHRARRADRRCRQHRSVGGGHVHRGRTRHDAPRSHLPSPRQRRDHGSQPDLHGRRRDRGRRLESGHASDLVRLRSDRDTGSDPDGDPERGVMVGRRLAGARPGTYTARAEQTDGAGNTGQSAAVTFTADAPDTTPPRSHPLPARKRRDHGSQPDLHGRRRDRGRRLESGSRFGSGRAPQGDRDTGFRPGR